MRATIRSSGPRHSVGICFKPKRCWQSHERGAEPARPAERPRPEPSPGLSVRRRLAQVGSTSRKLLRGAASHHRERRARRDRERAARQESGNAFLAQLGPSLSGVAKPRIDGELRIAKEAPVEIDGSPGVVGVIVAKIFDEQCVGAHAPRSEPPLRLASKIAAWSNLVCSLDLRFIDEQIDIPCVA